MFNDKQLQVIDTIDKNLLVLSLAGTGKTNTLSERIANIINLEKAQPSELLVLTFTNRACKEMRERIEKVVGLELSKNITIRTFHSFCYDVIKTQAKKSTDVFTDAIIYDEEDCKEVIDKCKKQSKELSGISVTSNMVKGFIDFIKESMCIHKIYNPNDNITYNEVINLMYKDQEVKIDELCSEKSVLNRTFKECMRKYGGQFIELYNRTLVDNRAMDFIDLISKAQELFNNVDIAEAYRSKYKFINVDEVQDTSVLEYSIIVKLFAGNNVLLCGDPFQTIYQWRGSEPRRIIKSFTDKYHPQVIRFDKSYRSTQNLTQASVGYLKNAFPVEIQDNYKEGVQVHSNEEGEKIGLKEVNDIIEEANFIFHQIQSLKDKKQGTCILTRDNYYNQDLSKVFEGLQSSKDDFEFVLVDQFKFFRRKEIKDAIAFLKIIANQHDSLSLQRIINNFSVGIGETTLKEIDSIAYRQLGIKLSDFLSPTIIKTGDFFSELIEGLNANNIVVFDVESTGIDYTEDEIIQIAALRIDKEGNEIERFEKFIKPNKSVKASEHVHHFSDEYLESVGENKVHVLKEFCEFAQGSIVVGHNVGFDLNIMNSELSREGLPVLDIVNFYDTLDIYRRFYPNQPNHKLDTLSRIFGTEHQPSHNAMDDILATGELLIMAVKNNILPTSFQRMNAISRYLKGFDKISEQLRELMSKVNCMRPYELMEYIQEQFDFNNKYSQEKQEYLKQFLLLLRELDNLAKGNRDALLEILKITSLSNGELENAILQISNKIRIPIITVHQAKGLEYENVFLAGAQESRFPSYRSKKPQELEEEKRAFYVAITRAKEELYISVNHKSRYGVNKRSRFIEHIPREYIQVM